MEVPLRHRIDHGTGKALFHSLFYPFQDHVIAPLSPDGIVGSGGSPIQGKGQKINVVAGNPIQDIMEEIAVGINGNGFKPQLLGCLDGHGKVRVKGGLPAQKNEVGGKGPGGKKTQPGLDGLYIKGVCPVLVLIDIAMAAGKIALCQDMEKEIGRLPGKRNGLLLHTIPCIAW
jgi:hypothetical protein